MDFVEQFRREAPTTKEAVKREILETLEKTPPETLKTLRERYRQDVPEVVKNRLKLGMCPGTNP